MKSFISKKKEKKVEKSLEKEEIIIPNINIAELDKKFALLEMNNSFLKKNKSANTQLPNIDTRSTDPHISQYIFSENLRNKVPVLGRRHPIGSGDTDKQDIVNDSSLYDKVDPNTEGAIRTPASSDEIEFEIEFDNEESNIPEEETRKTVNDEIKTKKPILKLSNKLQTPSSITKNISVIKPTLNTDTRFSETHINLLDFVDKLQSGTDKKIEDIIPSLSSIMNKKSDTRFTETHSEGTKKSRQVSNRSIELYNNPSKIGGVNNIGDTPRNLELGQFKLNKSKSGDDFNLKNVVSKLENIGISEHKSFNYNTIIKNESINCNSYNCMYDTSNNSSVSLLNINKENVNCWWCRHSIPENVHLIGCPIKYQRAVSPSSSTLGGNEYFETEGFFCSFNCVLAYNNEVSQHNIRYRESGGLIYLLYKKLFGFYPYQMNIKPAPSWKILKSYGGDMTIQEYRNTFQKVEILSENVIKNKEITCLMPSSMIFIEEKSNIRLSQNEF